MLVLRLISTEVMSMFTSLNGVQILLCGMKLMVLVLQILAQRHCLAVIDPVPLNEN